MTMSQSNFHDSYVSKVKGLLASTDQESAMSQAVGGEFETVGRLEFMLLKHEGLRPEHTIIDAGCGSGRLAVQLRNYLTGTYVGFDVVPSLLEHAESLCKRPDWRFYQAPGTTIPESSSSADFIAFFSVFTHLLHEETYRYLDDAARVIKRGGKVVFSFLEYRLGSHWAVFDASVKDTSPDKVLNQFMDRDMIHGIAERIGLQTLAIFDGDKPHIPLEGDVHWGDGRVMTGMGNLGQSVCVMQKV
jgi:ubiquinone/menaquinone biosynthesis C-methylase UbiE